MTETEEEMTPEERAKAFVHCVLYGAITDGYREQMTAGLIRKAEERGRLEVMPLITQGDGCIVFEWWRGGRKLTLRCPRVNEMVKRNNADREEIDVPDEADMQAAIRWLNESCSTPSRSIDAIIAEAEERGRLEEREACMQIVVGCIRDAGCGNSYSESFRWAATNILMDIDDRTAPPPKKELGAEESGGL